jgi:hypothetical protein
MKYLTEGCTSKFYLTALGATRLMRFSAPATPI